MGRYPVASPESSVGGQGKYPVAVPVPFEGSGEVPSGRPRTFCGGQWREGGMQGGSNGKENCDSKFVLAAAPLTNPKGQRCAPWICEWGCDQHKLAVTIPLSIAPSLHPSLPPLPPTEGAGAATGYLPSPLKRHGGGHWVFPLPPTEGAAVEKTLLVL